MNEIDFWLALDRLVAARVVTVDRPRGSAHPRYPTVIYPLDYGYLQGTRSGDGGGIDVWVGTLPHRSVTGIICTVDLDKLDAETKILLGCSPAEVQSILRFHHHGAQSAILIERRGS